MQNESSSTRLFESDFCEWFTHVHHNTPFFLFGPVFIGCLTYASLVYKFSTLQIALLAFSGCLIWSLFEYFMHRVLFHYEPTSNWGKRILYLFHGIHHDFPNETDRLVMPSITSLAIASFIFAVHYLLLGPAGIPMFAGFLAGYLYYEFVHYSVHNSKKKIGWTEAQRKAHLKHHFQDATNRFGVTSPLWDYIFGTYKEKV